MYCPVKKYIIAYKALLNIMILNSIFDNISVISWQSVLLVDEVAVPNQRMLMYIHLYIFWLLRYIHLYIFWLLRYIHLYIFWMLRYIHFLNVEVQYSQRHSVINHCDRSSTLLSDTDISFGLFNPFTYFDMPFGW
jgi:hypothetical protein